jgi:protein-S-isoprenylcysteine O-methyltransferase Ste14
MKRQSDGPWRRLRRRVTWRVIVVYCVFALLVVLSQPTPLSLLLGASCVVVGELVRVWAAGHLRKNEEVTTTGPYAYVKNPLYLGSLLIMVGFGVMSRVYWVLAVGVVVFLIYYAPYKKHRESDRLRERFGEAWTAYDVSVPDYIPRLSPYERRGTVRWRSSLVAENSEYGMAMVVMLGAVGIGLWWWMAP